VALALQQPGPLGRLSVPVLACGQSWHEHEPRFLKSWCTYRLSFITTVVSAATALFFTSPLSALEAYARLEVNQENRQIFDCRALSPALSPALYIKKTPSLSLTLNE